MLRPAQRVARQRQPGQGGQLGQPAGQVLQPVGGQADQLQPLRTGQAVGQGAQAVASQHQLLQCGALAQLRRQLGNGVVGQRQPAQGRRQGRTGHMGELAALEAHHLQRRAIAQHFGQVGKGVARAKHHFQAVQARQIVRQAGEAVVTEVEHLQRVGQAKHFGRQAGQPARQVKAARADQCAAAQLFQGVVHGEKIAGHTTRSGFRVL